MLYIHSIIIGIFRITPEILFLSVENVFNLFPLITKWKSIEKKIIFVYVVQVL